MYGVRGIEGSAGHIYFECFGAMLTKLPFGGGRGGRRWTR